MATITQLQELIAIKLADFSNIVPEEHREVANAFVSEFAMIGEIKMLNVTQEFIDANFDATGLGVLSFTGWANCNGNNGTKNFQGRVAIGNSEYYPIGTTGGNKDAVVVSHKHDSIVFSNGKKAVNDVGTGLLLNGQLELSTPSSNGYVDETSTVGVDGTDKNMQPYISILFIQRIA